MSLLASAILKKIMFTSSNSSKRSEKEEEQGEKNKKLPLPGFEPGFSEPQSEVLTTILQ